MSHFPFDWQNCSLRFLSLAPGAAELRLRLRGGGEAGGGRLELQPDFQGEALRRGALHEGFHTGTFARGFLHEGFCTRVVFSFPFCHLHDGALHEEICTTCFARGVLHGDVCRRRFARG